MMAKEKQKEKDFVFGFTIFSKCERDKRLDSILSIVNNFENRAFYIRNEKTGENTFLKTDDYFDEIRKSKYTLVIPPYDESCFSIYRFIESLGMDCLPLIHPDCKTSDVEKSFGVGLEALKRNTPFETEKEYFEVLRYYQEKFLVFKESFTEF